MHEGGSYCAQRMGPAAIFTILLSVASGVLLVYWIVCTFILLFKDGENRVPFPKLKRPGAG
jgi:hypothetical protein